MKIVSNGKSVGVSEEYWKRKSFEEFKEFHKGKILSTEMKGIFDSFALPKPKVKAKEKVEK